MSKLIDLTGRRFNNLLVIKRNIKNDKYNKPLWICLCDCGKTTIASGEDLKSNKKKSCGCLKHNRSRKEKIKKDSQIEKNRKKRVGEERLNNEGYLMRIIQYNNSQDVLIEFQDEYKYQKKVEYGNFKKGTIKNPYKPILYDRGYLGAGDYKPSQNRQSTKQYDAWRKMFDRCYSENYHKKEPTYIGCEVCKEWYNFQVFAKWYDENFIQIEDCIMQIDKDWKIPNNKIYSPKTCEIVPNIINTCILSHDSIKQTNLPRNIIYTTSKKYKPRLSKYGKRMELGTFENLEDAMKIYLNEKIKYIKEIANKYKDYISEELYIAMINYKTRFLKENPEYATIQ